MRSRDRDAPSRAKRRDAKRQSDALVRQGQQSLRFLRGCKAWPPSVVNVREKGPKTRTMS
jgi:hypothetical protein